MAAFLAQFPAEPCALRSMQTAPLVTGHFPVLRFPCGSVGPDADPLAHGYETGSLDNLCRSHIVLCRRQPDQTHTEMFEHPVEAPGGSNLANTPALRIGAVRPCDFGR